MSKVVKRIEQRIAIVNYDKRTKIEEMIIIFIRANMSCAVYSFFKSCYDSIFLSLYIFDFT